MINNSKILTVSYGTFSCTLEGFDDSFNTMKAIAEYFRDLAADDRYFGAEPPTPDAEMLARIAEREIERRVQARQDDGKIVLRAEEPAAVPAETTAPQPAPLAAPAPAPAEAAPAQPVAEAAAAVAPTAEAAFTAPMPAPQPQPAAPEAEAEPDVTADAPVLSEPFVPEAAEEVEEPEQDISFMPEAELAEPAPETVEEPAAEEAEMEAEPEPAPEPEAAQPEPEAERVFQEVSHPDPDSVAAKLRRIRSVVSQSDQDYGDSEYSEDEHAQDFLENTAADLDAALAVDDAAEEAAIAVAEPAEEPVIEEEPVIDTASQEDDDLSLLMANVAAHSDDDDEGASAEAVTQAVDEETQPLEDSAAEIEEDTLAQLLADAMPEGETASADIAEEDMTEEDVFEDETLEEDALDEDTPDEAQHVTPQRPLRARVVKMKRADLEAALATGELEAAEAQDTVNLFSDEPEEGLDSGLSPEEEAELQRELAQVEADFAGEQALEEDDADEEPVEASDIADYDDEYDDDYDDEDEDQDDYTASEAADPDSPEARGVDRLKSVEQGSDVSRIFDEADSHSKSPESSERRNAIQHLRAAVAATRAEKKAGVDISKDVDDSAYRSDLADVVRPRRPRAGGTARSARPGMERPAPLKLVAEQRIDTPQEPVRPRRISSADLADMEADSTIADGDSGFAEFAEEMGAGSLPELLEAAAAYMADVEGRPQFSRPMLMGKLKEVEGEEFSREDGLRSFGQLLRQGKLQKLKGGRFSVTDETEFRAPARNAG